MSSALRSGLTLALLLLGVASIAIAQDTPLTGEAESVRAHEETPSVSQAELFDARGAVAEDAEREARLERARRVAPVDLLYGVP